MCQLGTYENPLVILKNEIKDIYIYILSYKQRK